jgi:predicted DNA-binding transcriptional regulator AlpA
VLILLAVSEKFEKIATVVKPLFSDLDRRRSIPLAEVAKVTGYPTSWLYTYAVDGTIPGARQAGPGKRWVFEREALERWWANLHAPKAGELE